MTQREQLLELLLSKPEGVYVYEINAPWPTGLGISQYGRCVKELRESGHKVINDRIGHFVLQPRMTMEEMRKKVEHDQLLAARNKYV